MARLSRPLIGRTLTARCLLSLASGVVTLTTPAIAGAQARQVKVEAIPDSLSLGPDGSAMTTIVVRNGSPQLIRRLRLRADAPQGLTASIDTQQVPELPASGEFVTTARVVGNEPVQSLRRLHVFAEFERTTADTQRGTPAVEVATIRVAPGPYERADQIADIQVSSSLATLTDKDTGVVYLIVKNKADSHLRVDSVLAVGPAFLRASAQAGITIPPFSTGYATIVVHARERRVRPGKHLLIFDIPMKWTTAGGPRSGRAVHSREVDVGVFGEAEILKAVAVPSFLLLPGALMVLMYGLLWRHAARRRAGAGTAPEFPLRPTTLEFWVVAVTLSGVMAFLFPVVPWIGRDYLHGYGTGDVATVWLISVLLGTVAYATVDAWSRFSTWRQTSRITPGVKDRAIKVLRKIALQQESLIRPVVSVQQNGSTLSALLLQPADASRDGAVVGPAIRVEWRQNPQPAPAEQTALESMLATDDAAKVADFLEPREADGRLKLLWEPLAPGSVARVTRVPAVTATAGQRRLVQVDTV